MTASTTEPRDVRYAGERQLGLWFGALGGAAAWMLHLFGCYAIAEFGCVSGLGHVLWYGLSVVVWLCLATTAATLLAALAATLAAWRQIGRTASSETQGDWLRRIAGAGVFLSGFFAAAILFESIPLLYYLRC